MIWFSHIKLHGMKSCWPKPIKSGKTIGISILNVKKRGGDGEIGKWKGIFDKPTASISLIKDKTVEFLFSIFND